MRALLLVLGFILLNKIANTQVVLDANERLGEVLFGGKKGTKTERTNLVSASVVSPGEKVKAPEFKTKPLVQNAELCRGKVYNED